MDAGVGEGVAGIRYITRGRLLAGVSGAALGLACWSAAPVSAATYFVSDATELTNAITTANGDGDPSSTIEMTQSFGVLSTTTLPTPTKPLTIDTQGFVLSGIPVNTTNPG